MYTVWAQRREEVLRDCIVSPDVFTQIVDRLDEFVGPYQHALETEAGQRNVYRYLQGLLSHLPGKNAEDIATFVNVERQVIQDFIGTVPWDHRPLVAVLVGQVAERLGEPDGIIAFDPSSFPKRGTYSVGVKRQWCSHRGKVDNCQVGVYMGYVSRHDYALLDFRLSLPEEWARDEQRRQACHVPPEVRYHTRQEQCIEMLDLWSEQIPHGWVTGDDELGRHTRFRHELRARGERYLLGVPCTTTIRDLEAPLPAYAGRGRRPKAPWQLVTPWRRSLAAQDARHRYHYYLTPTGGPKVAFKEPSLEELARVIKAGACIEASFKRGKGEVGMDEYQVRTWQGWQHHMVLSLLAVWFLIGETHRSQSLPPALTLPQVRYGLSLLLLTVFCPRGVDSICRRVQRQLQRNELARFYHHRTRKCAPPRKLRREIQ